MGGRNDDFTGIGASDDSSPLVTGLLLAGSIFLIIITMPFSLFMCIKVVQVPRTANISYNQISNISLPPTKEYERAVIFRLGRVKSGGAAAGPGLFFVVPCTDTIVVTDLRTISFDVPPQEILTKVKSPPKKPFEQI